MSQSILATLPAPLAAYFTTADHRDKAGFFADDAVVRDEGATYTGKPAITGWLDSVERRYQPRYVVTDAATEGDRIVVSYIVSGTFPGSPATLRQAFSVEGGLIRSLSTL